jgi:hypothetical protein
MLMYLLVLRTECFQHRWYGSEIVRFQSSLMNRLNKIEFLFLTYKFWYHCSREIYLFPVFSLFFCLSVRTGDLRRSRSYSIWFVKKRKNKSFLRDGKEHVRLKTMFQRNFVKAAHLQISQNISRNSIFRKLY